MIFVREGENMGLGNGGGIVTFLISGMEASGSTFSKSYKAVCTRAIVTPNFNLAERF